jgi:S-disulfanyl-L-cysteine oxidoreductase SoxD
MTDRWGDNLNANHKMIFSESRQSCFVAACLAVAAATVTSAPNDSYFGDRQSQRGESLYQTHCGACHGDDLQGKSAVALVGAGFLARWSHEAHSVDDLLYIVRTQMPYGEPNKLPKSEYLDIVAFILKANQFPGGGEDLPLDSKVLSAKKLKR